MAIFISILDFCGGSAYNEILLFVQALGLMGLVVLNDKEPNVKDD